MKGQIQDVKSIWNNRVIPVVVRSGNPKPLLIRIPYSSSNRAWLKNGVRKKEPQWIVKGEYWELPASRFNELVNMILDRFGNLYIIQPYREKEVCARACMEAMGFECQCSCMGANHGSANSKGWFEVSETFAVRYGERQFACRLIRSAAELEVF